MLKRLSRVSLSAMTGVSRLTRALGGRGVAGLPVPGFVLAFGVGTGGRGTSRSPDGDGLPEGGAGGAVSAPETGAGGASTTLMSTDCARRSRHGNSSAGSPMPGMPNCREMITACTSIDTVIAPASRRRKGPSVGGRRVAVGAVMRRMLARMRLVTLLHLEPDQM